MGYGWVQVSMGPALLAIPLWVVLLLPFAKILTTGLSIGSGGSGGIFGPGMVIGAMVGAIIWRLCYHVLPGVPDTPAPFVIVGMMALFGGIAHAPLAVMLMVAEMTGNLSMLAPANDCGGHLRHHRWGEDDLHQPGRHAGRFACTPAPILSFPLLSTLPVRQAMTPLALRFSPQHTVAEAEALLAERTLSGATVLDGRGEPLVGHVP